MQSFLEQVSEYIFQNCNNRVSELSIILPNKRAGIFLKKYLARKFKQPVWAPKIYSIDEFMAELSGVTVAEPINITFELYDIYKKNEGKNAQSFIEFIRWAPVLINDFNEIDSYCANADNLFNYLNEIRAIELWNPSTLELSSFQKQYLDFWKSLGKLYSEFSQHLINKNLVYHGLAYRLATDKVKSQDQPRNIGVSNLQSPISNLQSPILFIGFNALTKAEEIIIEHLILQGKAEIIWDADHYYLDNKSQEAGKFLRKYIYSSQSISNDKASNRHTSLQGNTKEFPICNYLRTASIEIEIIGVAGNIAQTKVAGDILASIYDSKNNPSGTPDFLNTAVVLSDESLLIPLLNSLPENVKNVNITMGYPLKSSSFHDFWNSFFMLHENESFGKADFYHKNIIQILSHPFLALSKDIVKLIHEIISEIKQKNRIYISLEELENIALNANKTETFKQIQPLFADWKNDPIIAINTAIYFVRLKIGEKNMEAEILSRYLEIFHQIQSLLKQFNIITDIRTLRVVFNQISGNYTVPFTGEPLTGLQIMGMLETRTLDFETVILLSANEDVLPSGKKQNSFIPLDIKKQFQLPTYNDRDAIFAYHFYRLIQRAKKVFILYNNDVSKSFGAGGGEKSRFITQIQEELPKINPEIKITEKIHSFSSIIKNKINLRISKNEHIIKRLDELSKKGFSPTAINTFINCPLDFYYKYIIGLREVQEVEENIEAAAFGDFIHLSLQNLYTPFIGKIISADDIVQRKKDCKEITKAAFLQQYSEQDINFGKNLLTLKVAEKLVTSYLNMEIEFLKKLKSNGEVLTILDLEKEMEMEISINGKTVKFIGKADRIDKIGQSTRIIDYKTGNVQPADLKIENTEITLFEKPKPKAVQLLMYALIYSIQTKHALAQSPNSGFTGTLTSGIISMRKLSEVFMPLMINGNEKIERNYLQLFEQELPKIISEMYNPALLLEHNHNSEYCEFCRAY